MAHKDKQNRTIVLPISETDYTKFVEDIPTAHQIIRQIYDQHPSIFPIEMQSGYKLNGSTAVSKKTGYFLRRIDISGISYQIRPSFLMSYMRAKVSEVEKALFLIRFGICFWALAHVFGRNPMFWYRCYRSLGSNSLVGTTVYNTAKLPEDVLADEFHTRIQGKKAYVATTVSQGCFLGMDACWQADQVSLNDSYSVFKEEAQNIDPTYSPKTANTDGWQATQNAWKALFPTIFIIECFLHAYLKVRDRATKVLKTNFMKAADKIWHIYRAENKRQMSQRLRRLHQWAKAQLSSCAMKENILKLYDKKQKWLAHLDYTKAYRTSNQLDRLMRAMKKHAINSQKFHADIKSTTLNFRAFALLYNFTPSCPAVVKKNPDLASPAARLNGFCFHQNWLENLLIASSLAGYKQQQIPL